MLMCLLWVLGLVLGLEPLWKAHPHRQPWCGGGASVCMLCGCSESVQGLGQLVSICLPLSI